MTSAKPRPSARPPLSSSLERNPDLDTWLEIDRDGTVTIRTGKAELGQGLCTAIARICAEELDLPLERVRVETADTARGPMEFMTVGSMSMEDSGSAVRQVCAEARHHLLEQAAKLLGIPMGALRVVDGEIFAAGVRRTSYAELMGGRRFERRVTGEVWPKSPAAYRYVGRKGPRIDLEAKLTRGALLHDLCFEGMLHARVLRPPSYLARLVATDVERVRSSPGVVEVVRDGAFLAVVCDDEACAVRALEELATLTSWDEHERLPPEDQLATFLLEHTSQSFRVVEGTAVAGEVLDATPSAGGTPHQSTESPGQRELRATYLKPYIMHASISPSVGIALWDGERLTVWSHSQGVAILRLAIADSLALDRSLIRVVHVPGAGSYGHNGADDAAFDACLIALACPNQPIRVQWMREDENLWEPYSPAARVDLTARVDAHGRIENWRHDVHSNSHMGRPLPAGGKHSNFIADWHRVPAKPPIPAQPRLEAHAGIHRNADPYYSLPDRQIFKHFVGETPLRVSSTRGLGAFANVFAIESFMDELAHASGQDPLELRLRYLDDPRARAVLLDAAQRAGWSEHRSSKRATPAPPALAEVSRTAPGSTAHDATVASGLGLSFARYKNVKCYAAVAVWVDVQKATGRIQLRRVVISADAGQIIDPDGLTNQLEGGFIQAASWTLKEKVRFDRVAVRSRDWESYPILRFDEIPEFETSLLDQPGMPILGAGEATQGPTPAAIANAVFDATGARLRELPLSPERVLAVMGGERDLA